MVLVFSGRCGNATVGRMADRSMSITLSYTASSSASYTVNGRFTRPFTYSSVISSTAKMPFFAPASIAMLAMHSRSSIERLFNPSPENSIDWYSAPSTPILADDVQNHILAG